jgi:hypothetical protein
MATLVRMKLRHTPIRELRAMLRATERAGGANTVAAGLIRRELSHRRQLRPKRAGIKTLELLVAPTFAKAVSRAK